MPLVRVVPKLITLAELNKADLFVLFSTEVHTSVFLNTDDIRVYRKTKTRKSRISDFITNSALAFPRNFYETTRNSGYIPDSSLVVKVVRVMDNSESELVEIENTD